jgi:hypothetical protein
VADYPDPYPNRAGKIVTVEDFDHTIARRDTTRAMSMDAADSSPN